MNIRPLLVWCLLSCGYAYADSAATYYESALRFNQQQELRKAELELRNSLQQNPKFLPARLLLGQILLQSHQYVSAAKELQLALDGGASPDPVAIDLMRAVAAQEQIETLIQLLERYQPLADLPEYQLQAAALLKLQFKYDEAAAVYQKLQDRALQGEVANEMWFELADLQLKQQQYKAVSNSLQQISGDSQYFRRSQYLRAHILSIQQNYLSTLAIYQQLLAQKPDDSAALLGQAQALLQQGKTDEALKSVLQFQKTQPNNPYGQLIHAAILGQQGNVAEQERMVRQVQQQLSNLTSEEREKAEVLLLTATIDYSQQKFAPAAQKLTRYQRLYPANYQVSQLLAQTSIMQQDYDAAAEHIETALKINPNEVQLYLIAASIYQQQQRFDAEQQILTNGFEKFPTNDIIRRSYIQLLVKNGDAEQAQKMLAETTDVIQRQSDQILLGYLQLENNQLDQAAFTANTLLSKDQSKVEIYQLAGDIAARSGQAQNARQFYQEALKLDSHYKPALLSLASLALAQQNQTEAVSAFERILEKEPTDSLTLQLMADAAVKQGNLAKAIEFLQQLDSEDRDLIPARLTLLDLYLMTGQLDNASGLLELLANQIDVQPALYLGRAKLALLQGQPELARKNTEILFGLWYDNPPQLLQLSDIQLQNGDLEGATATIARLVALKNSGPALLFVQARLALIQQDFKRGKSLLELYEKSAGVSSASNELRAHFELAQGNFTAATALLKPLFAVSGDSRHLVLLLKAQQQDLLAVRALLQQWLQQNPDDYSATVLLAEQLEQAGLIPAAIEVYRQSPALAQQPVLLNNLANLYLKTGDASAVEYARQAWVLMPEQPDILDTYGYALIKNGQLSEGLGVLREAEIRAPQSTLLQLHLAEALLLQKRPDEAKTILTKVSKMTLTESEQRLMKVLQQQMP